MLEFTKFMDYLTTNWLIKAVGGFFVATFSFLIGEVDAAFIALWVLVGIDTITKVVGLVYNAGGFKLAVLTKVVTSEKLRSKFCTKAFAYIVIIIAANMLCVIVPDIRFLGSEWAKIACSFVYSFLAITEILSIVENLVEMGFDSLKPLVFFFKKKRSDMTGAKEEI